VQRGIASLRSQEQGKKDAMTPIAHGQIIGGVVTTPHLGAALDDYGRVLGLRLVEQGALDAGLAASWGCGGSAGSPYAVLQPVSGHPCFIRLVEQSVPEAFRPTTSYGWAAFELTVQDVFGWPARLAGSGFAIVGPPKELAGLPYFVPMQVTGRGDEMIYLNEVRSNTPSSDLPMADCLTDRMFICILAAKDRAATCDWYARTLGLDLGETYTLAYSMINSAFGLPDDHMSDLTMVQNGRMTILEVDDYPPQTTERPRDPGRLPPGNALVTLAVDKLDRAGLDWITPPAVREGAIYAGRRSATLIGPSGEYLELVERAG
jgi:catechol 2,3-dioxygenase-like lactoylglutathione lyase family enzyme